MDRMDPIAEETKLAGNKLILPVGFSS